MDLTDSKVLAVGSDIGNEFQNLGPNNERQPVPRTITINESPAEYLID